MAGGSNGIVSLPAIPSLFSTTDTISIWLALLGIMIALSSLVVTGVGLVVGALAIFGYQTFREEVKRSVNEATDGRMNEFFGGPAFDAQLGDKIDDKVKEHLTAKSWESGTATRIGPAQTFNVKRYPGRRKQKTDVLPPAKDDTKPD